MKDLKLVKKVELTICSIIELDIIKVEIIFAL